MKTLDNFIALVDVTVSVSVLMIITRGELRIQCAGLSTVHDALKLYLIFNTST